MDAAGRVVAVRSGREWTDWSPELRVGGEELRWKFSSDGSVNGWGWRFTVYPVMPSSSLQVFLKRFCCANFAVFWIRIRDPVPFLTPGSGIRNSFFPDPGSQSHIFESLVIIFYPVYPVMPSSSLQVSHIFMPILLINTVIFGNFANCSRAPAFRFLKRFFANFAYQ
jgi:hypothetical protein